MDRAGSLAIASLSIPDLLTRGGGSARAVLAPGREPLVFDGLRAQIDETRQALNGLGLGRNDRVALVLPNGPEMATAFLAVSACATCAPLNPDYRADEFDFYLGDLNAKALIVQGPGPASEVARSRGIAVIELVSRPGAPAGVFSLSGGGLQGSPATGFARPGDTALLLHTSGTTSRPKLVPLTHANLCSSAANIARTLALTDADRCLNVMPLFHIHGLIAALLSSLAAGGSVLCAPRFDAANFFSWWRDYRPSWYTAVPTMHQAIVAHADAERGTIENDSLRFIRSSSAALPAPVAVALERVFGAPVVEAYGMTEASHQMTSNPLPPAVRKPRSVGIAAGPEVAIMDDNGKLLAAGQSGEVVICGGNVMAGYENNPEANRTSFSNGWFRTGDQGYFDDDGYLFLTGRLKEIVNRGGEKISPREIDEALLEHPAIAQAVAFAVPHPTLGDDLAAAVVLKKNGGTTESALREFLFNHLADFKVPSRIVIVDTIPKGPTGKLQRIGLADKLTSFLRKPPIAPRNEFERIVADIFAEVLGADGFGIDDNFFALGGDSLRATQVMARIAAISGIELPNVIVFRKPTIAGLAGEIAESIKRTDPELAGILDGIYSIEELEKLLADGRRD